MATKKVLVEINVEQKGSALEKTTKEVKELTAVEKERLKIKKDTERTDAKLEVVNDKATKNLEKRKNDLKDVNDLSKTWTGIMKESVAQIGKTNDGLKNLNADYALWEKQSAAAAKQQEKLNKELEDEQIKLFQAQVKKLTKDETLLEKQTKKLAFAQSDEAKKLAIVAEQTKRANYELNQYAKEQVDAANATENTNDKMQKFKTTSGLTGAIVTEFGRTASDSAYGIRGMGNNISQIVTLFGQLQANTVKAGGTIKDSLNQIFQSMKGIIGLMTAIQVVLGIVQAEWFQKWLSGLFSVNDALKTNIELMKEAANIAGNSVGKFKVYISLLNDEATEQSEKLEIIKKLNEEYPEFNTNLYENTERTKEQVEAEKDYIRLLKQRAKSEAAVQKFQEAQGKLIDLESQRDLKIAPIQEEIDKIRELGAMTALTTNQVNAIIKDGYTTREEISKQAIRLRNNEINQIEKSSEKEIKAAEKIAKSYEKYFDASGIGGDSSSDGVKRGFRSRLLNLQTLAEKFRQDSLKAEVKTDEELIREKAEFSKKDLEIKLNNFEETEKLRLKEFLKTKGLSDKQKLDAIKSSEDSINKAKEDSKIVLANIEAVYDAEINLLRRKEGERARAEQEARDRAEALKGIDRGSEGVLGFNQGFVDAQNQRIQNEIDYQNRLLEATEKGTLERSQAEQAYYDANNQMIQFNLEQERLAAEEKQRVNNEYVSYLSGLSSILGAITNKNKEWQKAALITEKAAAIGGVVTAAAKSIGVSTAATAAANQQIIAKYAAIPGGSIPAGLEIKANTALYRKGVANTKIGAGLSIAAITAGAISGVDSISTGGSDSSGSGSQTVQPPDFNIVGSTGVNQLADAIGSTEKEPVKAYVSVTDVMTKEALIRNNRNNAEL